MIKHFCSMCEKELDSQRIGRTNIVVSLMTCQIAIDIRMHEETAEAPEVCAKCLFEMAAKAKTKYFTVDLNTDAVDEISKDHPLITLTPPKENAS